MDYNLFGQVLKSKGISNDPAWQDLKVLIAPLPPMKESPLGLYYPDGDPNIGLPPNTIWIPPEANEDTELHELGHRFYHYYYNDLSEPQAERFRLKYNKIKVAMYNPSLDRRRIGAFSDYDLALIQEQIFSHGDIPRDEILYSDVRLPV